MAPMISEQKRERNKGEEQMRNLGTKRLETDRLILRRFVKEDSECVYKNWASDDEVTKYLT